MKQSVAMGILNAAAVMVLLGGCFDMFLPAVPSNLLDYIQITRAELSPPVSALMLGLLRALGGSLFAVGFTALVLINGPVKRGERWASWTLLCLIAVSEGINASQMARFGSPYYFPLAFIALTMVGLIGRRVPTTAKHR